MYTYITYLSPNSTDAETVITACDSVEETAIVSDDRLRGGRGRGKRTKLHKPCCIAANVSGFRTGTVTIPGVVELGIVMWTEHFTSDKSTHANIYGTTRPNSLDDFYSDPDGVVVKVLPPTYRGHSERIGGIIGRSVSVFCLFITRP